MSFLSSLASFLGEADRSTKERAEILNNTVSTDPMPLNVSMPIKSIASPQSEVSAPANSCEPSHSVFY